MTALEDFFRLCIEKERWPVQTVHKRDPDMAVLTVPIDYPPRFFRTQLEYAPNLLFGGALLK
jgi:hypothetical protein